MTRKDELKRRADRLIKRRMKCRQKIVDKFGTYGYWCRYHHKKDLFSEEVRCNLKSIREELATINKCIKRIDRYHADLKVIHYYVCNYFDVPTLRRLKRADVAPKSVVAEARGVFCKYALENLSMEGAFISDFLGCSFNPTAGRIRLRFTRSFKNHPDRLKRFQEVSAYIRANIYSLKPKNNEQGKSSRKEKHTCDLTRERA